MKGRSIPFLFLATIVFFFYLLCRQLECLPYFFSVVGKVVGVLATRKISFLLPGIRGFSLAVRLLLPALINAEDIPLIGNMMFPTGASGPSNSLPSSGPRWDIDLNSIPPLGEEEIQGAIDLNKTPRQLDAEAQLLQKRQLEIDEKRASIRAWVDWRIRTEIETQGGPPLVGPIENLDEQVSTVITFGPQTRDPSNLTKVGRCLSILNNKLWSEKDSSTKIQVEKAIVEAVRLYLVEEREDRGPGQVGLGSRER